MTRRVRRCAPPTEGALEVLIRDARGGVDEIARGGEQPEDAALAVCGLCEPCEG
jgi:hypothetical protein